MLKRLFYTFITIYLLVIASTSCSKDTKKTEATPNDTIPVPDGWALVWHDEFDVNTLDTNHWEYEVNAEGGGNNELQYYTDSSKNSYISNGRLVIQALKETYTGSEGTREYTSARVRSLNHGDWLYGRFEIRAKLPIGKGLWPAIWMLPSDWKYGGWAASGEIDIMELIGSDSKTVYGTLHYGGVWPKNVQSGSSFTLTQGSFYGDFHVFSLEWDSSEFRWYVDDSLYLKQTQWNSAGAPYPAPFNQRFHLILNLAVGGNWPGNPDATTLFPQTMEVDYVRIFKKQ